MVLKTLKTYEEVCALINSGNKLVITAEDAVMAKLPKGNWVGGTIPYFLTAEGGMFNQELYMVTDFTDTILDFKIIEYTESTIETVINDSFGNGFTFLMLPFLKPIHTRFALHIPNNSNLYNNPLLGFVVGTKLDVLGKKASKVYNGLTGQEFEEKGIAMHCSLPSDKVARLEIINIFEQDEKADELIFEESDFIQKTCLVNGVKRNFAEYIQEKKHDIKIPLIADYSGALINVSFAGIDEATGEVKFLAPLYANTVYKSAKAVGNYSEKFLNAIPKGINTNTVAFSCNCVCNYAYGELEGKQVGLYGPATFGEIAYLLLNQTLTYLVIE